MQSLSRGVNPMFSNKERFKRYFLQRLEMTYGKTFEDTTSSDHFQTLGHMIREYVSSNWIQTNVKLILDLMKT